MIEEITLRNFKGFEHQRFALRPLTVLTGVNGGGKSTVVQSLLLAKQAAEPGNGRGVKLNGPYGLALGEAYDVLHWGAEESNLAISLRCTGGDAEYVYAFAVPSDRAVHLPLGSGPARGPGELCAEGRRFAYLCAERLGPRAQLPVAPGEPDELWVGVQGEFTAQVLATHGRQRVHSDRVFPGDDDAITGLLTQTERWASHIIRPVRLTVDWLGGVDISTIRFQESSGLEVIRPTNMGFGVSYALPVIVAGLHTEPDGLLIVENPEAHLHPAGQSRLGAFLARVAATGTQVIVETHSDHVLNGMRLAVSRDAVLDPSAAVIHYFSDSGAPTTIDVTPQGGLSGWPPGFFDQIERDLGELARAKRRMRETRP